MADLIASVALKLHDQFSAPALKAKAVWADLETGAQRAQFAGAKMVDVGKKATMAMSVPLVGIGVAALKAGVDFNKGLANVASLGVAEKRVQELGQNVQNMAVQFGQSTASLNDGLYNVISAFGDTADTSKTLEINTKAAAAGMATTSEAIALTSAVTKGYGDTSATAMQKAADLAFQTVKLGQTTFPELAASIGKVTGNANALGVSQEDLFAVFATTTGVVGSAAEVSTSTAAILTEMVKPGKALAGAIADLGYSSSDAMIAQLGFGGAIQALGASAQASGQKITNLFSSSEAGKVAMVLAGASADTYNEKLKEMYSSSGALDAAFTAQTGGINKLGFQFEQLKSQVAVSAQNIGQGLMPALALALRVAEPLAAGISNLAIGFGKLSQPIQNTLLLLGGVAVAAGPVAMVAGAVMNLGGKFMAAIPKAYAFAVAHWAALGPILLIAAGIAAVVAIGVLLYKNWETVRAFAVKVWDGIVFGVKTAISWFSNLLNNPFFAAIGVLWAPWVTIPVLVVKTIMTHWQPIKAFFASLWQGITAAASAVGNYLMNIFAPIGNAIITIWQPVQAFFVGLWSGLLSVLHTVGDWFSGIFTNLASLVISVWKPVKEFFETLFAPVSKGINMLTGAWQWLVGGGKKAPGSVPAGGNIKGFTGGGYTGPGSVNQIAGVVHAGEYVFSQDSVKRIGLDNLERLHRGRIRNVPGEGGGDSRIRGNDSVSVHIENLRVNAEDIEEISDFVRLLQAAARGAA